MASSFPRRSIRGNSTAAGWNTPSRHGRPRPRRAIAERRQRRIVPRSARADEDPPEVVHVPIQKCKAGQPLPIEAKVSDPDGVAVVRVLYRPLNESMPYESLVLERDGDTFKGTIPGAAIRPDFDFVYCLEAVDEGGTGCFYPDWTKTAPT